MEIHTGLYTDDAFVALMNASIKLKNYEESVNKACYSKLVSIKKAGSCAVLIMIDTSNMHYNTSRKRKIREYDRVYWRNSKPDRHGNTHEIFRRTGTYKVVSRVIGVYLRNPFYGKNSNELRILSRYISKLVKFGGLDKVIARGIIGKTPSSKTNKEFIKYVGEPFNGSSESYYDKYLKEGIKKIEVRKNESIKDLKSTLIETISNTAKPSMVRNHINLIDLVPGTIIKVPTLSGTLEEFKVLDVKISDKLIINLDRGTIELSSYGDNIGNFRYDYGVFEGTNFKLVNLNNTGYGGSVTIKMTPAVSSDTSAEVCSA